MIDMISQCGEIDVPLNIMAAVVKVESSGNPFAIGVVGDALVRQPRHIREAVVTVNMLEKSGKNYSLGAAQVNKKNFAYYGIKNTEDAFDFCTSIKVGAKILSECFERSRDDWGKAFSCYYSGNFSTGFKDGYVEKVNAALNAVENKKDANFKWKYASNQNLKRREISAANNKADKRDFRGQNVRTSGQSMAGIDINHSIKPVSEQNIIPYTSDAAFVF
jgi:type IV secretion system protein VirB1